MKARRPNDPPLPFFMSPQASRQAAMRRTRWRQITSVGEVQLNMEPHQLEVWVGLTPNELASHRMEGMTTLNWCREYPELIQRTSLHLEILQNLGDKGFTVRAIRRGRPEDGVGFWDLAEHVFLVRKVPLTIKTSRIEAEASVQDEMAESLPVPMTAPKFVDLFKEVSKCVLVLGGWNLEIRALYHKHAIHRTQEGVERSRREDAASTP